MRIKVLLAVWLLPLILFTAAANPAENKKEFKTEEPMTNARLETILRRVEPGVKGGDGRWQMMREGVPLLVLTDEPHNRMRIIAPAAEIKDVNRDRLMRMTEANFATALDARYAAFKGVMWAAFIHPLDSLRERDLLSALQQVINLVKTAGTTYSSSELQFGPPYEEN